MSEDAESLRKAHKKQQLKVKESHKKMVKASRAHHDAVDEVDKAIDAHPSH